ncbi:unnamed protein product [Polarella glacialis]|uniref:Uncharacterized protein n=1 Tax=Polarella glacialis TaxID=89957 RepID=A0A813H692_POLGL|nr:unnamed protein product [Polarella glacialis]
MISGVTSLPLSNVRGCQNIRITKVKAHTVASDKDTSQQVWARYWNGRADEQAKITNACRPKRFWQVWECAVQEQMQRRTEVKTWQSLLLDIGKAATDRSLLGGAKATQEASNDDDQQPDPNQVQPGVPLTELPSTSTKCSWQATQEIVKWWKEFATRAPEVEPIPLTWYHLYIDYRIKGRRALPQRRATTSLSTTSSFVFGGRFPAEVMPEPSFHHSVLFFQQIVQFIESEAGTIMGAHMTPQHRTPGGLLRFPSAGRFVRCSNPRLMCAHNALFRLLNGNAAISNKQLQVPLAPESTPKVAEDQLRQTRISSFFK